MTVNRIRERKRSSLICGSRHNQLIIIFLIRYRIRMPVTELMIFPDGNGYYVCPRCHTTEDNINLTADFHFADSEGKILQECSDPRFVLACYLAQKLHKLSVASTY